MVRGQHYRFGVFELNAAAHELRKHGLRVRLSGQPFALLLMLLESPGQIVSREEMRVRLWSTDTIVDFEHSLNSAIKKLRATLGDSPENSRYVETVPKVGYRFVAPVEVIVKEDPPATIAHSNLSAARSAPAAGSSQSQTRPSALRRIWAVGVCLLAVIIVAIAVWKWPRTKPAVPSGDGRVMIAVLPFDNLTGDASQDYFSDGLTEEMIEQLGRVNPQRLGVIARTSVARYKREGADLDRIQRELGVQYVLEGTVRRDTERVRVTAQLIRVKDQSHVWSREYDRTLDKLLVLQGEIAQQLAKELSLNFAPRALPKIDESLSPENYQAYDLYLKGRYFWNKRSTQGFERALECFQQSIQKDPGYARAYAGLADTYALISSYYIKPADGVKTQARAAARKAVELDDTLPEGHTSLALIAQNFDWDWTTAEKEYKRAIELDPNYATAHHWYAEELSLTGRAGESIAEIEFAKKLDPLSVIIATDRGVFLFYARQYDQAIEQFKTVLDMQPEFPRGHMIENVYSQKQMYAEALADSQEWQKQADNAFRVAMRSYIYGRMNNRAKASDELSNLRRNYGNHAAVGYLESFAYVGLNDGPNAIACLERAYADHSISTSVAVDPIFDPLRSDPRFQAILDKMHFPPNVNSAAAARK
ncbi:MAG TPA: winged helix-turn-helix domain-containing protein [Candidatus Acidoferrum sp.]|nr:winged helix-turn-helix domain-containing protein [Candidatus Acidoferrum sp.]